MSNFQHSEQTVKTSDGLELYVQTWAPSSPKAQVLIIHGYLEHCGRYVEVSEALANNSIKVTAFDLRGHGKSSGNRGYIQKWSDYHEDVSAVLATLDTTPCFVLGHSNGGLLALDYFNISENAKDIKGAIITSPFLKAADDLGCFKLCLSQVLGYLVPKLALPADVKSEDLTHDAVIMKANDEDPLVLKEFTLSWAVQGMAAQKRVLAQQDFSLPLLFVYAGDDKISDVDTNATYAASVQQDDKTVIARKDEYHEVLNEVNRKELYGTITDWILARAS